MIHQMLFLQKTKERSTLNCPWNIFSHLWTNIHNPRRSYILSELWLLYCLNSFPDQNHKRLLNDVFHESLTFPCNFYNSLLLASIKPRGCSESTLNRWTPWNSSKSSKSLQPITNLLTTVTKSDNFKKNCFPTFEIQKKSWQLGITTKHGKATQPTKSRWFGI